MVLLIRRLKQNIYLWCPRALQRLIDDSSQEEICLGTWQVSVLCGLVVISHWRQKAGGTARFPFGDAREGPEPSSWQEVMGRGIHMVLKRVLGQCAHWFLKASCLGVLWKDPSQPEDLFRTLQHLWAMAVFLWFVMFGLIQHFVTVHQRDKWAWWCSSVLALCYDQSLLGCQWWDRVLCLWLWSLIKLSILIQIIKLLGNK